MSIITSIAGIANNLGRLFNGNVSQNISEPVGNTWRGIGADLFNANAVAREDFLRAEQSADNQQQRGLQLQAQANAFTAQQADLAWSRTMEADNTLYQRRVEDMKKAGINPIMAISGVGDSSPTSPVASASSARSGGINYQKPNLVNTISILSQIGSGLLNASKGAMLSQTFNSNGELVKSVVSTKK